MLEFWRSNPKITSIFCVFFINVFFNLAARNEMGSLLFLLMFSISGPWFLFLFFQIQSLTVNNNLQFKKDELKESVAILEDLQSGKKTMEDFK